MYLTCSVKPVLDEISKIVPVVSLKSMRKDIIAWMWKTRHFSVVGYLHTV